MPAAWRGCRRGRGGPTPPSNSPSTPRARRWRRGRGVRVVRSCSRPRRFGRLPAEVALRLLGRAIDHVGDEGPIELGKLESLYAALAGARAPLRRTLAGALVTLKADRLTVERAPARRR